MLLGQQALLGWPVPLDLPARPDPQGPPGRRGQRVQPGFKARLGQPAPRGRLAPQVLQVPQAPKGKQETQGLQARLVPKDYKDPPGRPGRLPICPMMFLHHLSVLPKHLPMAPNFFFFLPFPTRLAISRSRI